MTKVMKSYTILDYEDKDIALTLFALGAGVMFVMRVMHQRDKMISQPAITKLRKKFERDGSLAKRKEQIGEQIPFVNKYVRILELQEDILRINQLLKIGNKAYPTLVELKAKLSHQIAEEVGDIKKGGGVHFTQYQHFSGDGKRIITGQERDDLIRALQEEAQADRN